MKKPLAFPIVFFIILYASLSFFSFISAAGDKPLFYAKLVWSLVVAALGFSIMRTGIIARYRSILFVLIAFFFFIEFKFFRFFSVVDTISPYCHIAQAPTLLNFIHSQFLAFTSGDYKTWGVLTLGFLWLLIMFTTGQGICSWVCFYGGIDEGCSKILKKPAIRPDVPRKWRDFPLAFLIFLLIVSFLQGSPVFCSWFCPLKMTASFWDHDRLIRTVQIAFFVLTLAGFLIVLPILTKKRTFCSLVCPFGALVSICGKLSPYRVTIDQEKCIHCGKCFDVCPVFAVERKDSKEFKISSYCNKCGACVDVCPVDAIPFETRDIFIFLSLLMTGVLSGTFVPRVILQLMGLK